MFVYVEAYVCIHTHTHTHTHTESFSLFTLVMLYEATANTELVITEPSSLVGETHR